MSNKRWGRNFAIVAENISAGKKVLIFDNEPRNRLWTAWLDNASNYKKDDEVKIEGALGTKVGTYNKPGQETKQIVEHSLNNCLVELVRAAEPRTALEEVINIVAPGEPKDLPF